MNDSPTIFHQKWKMGQKKHSRQFVYSNDLIMVIAAYSEEMSQPLIPLNISFFSAYHLGGVALTSHFEDCTNNAEMKEH